MKIFNDENFAIYGNYYYSQIHVYWRELNLVPIGCRAQNTIIHIYYNSIDRSKFGSLVRDYHMYTCE